MVGLGVKDYSGRQPNQEQLDDIVCGSDPKPGLPIVLDNYAALLEDAFLQNLTSTICQSKYPHLIGHFHQLNMLFHLQIN